METEDGLPVTGRSFSNLAGPEGYRELALHGGQRYEWFAPIGWNDDVQVTATVLKIVEKTTKNGPLWIADIQYDYALANTGELAVRELTRIIKRS